MDFDLNFTCSEVDNNKHIMLKKHAGHNVSIHYYKQEEEATVECDDCSEILLTFFKSEESFL